MQCNDFSLRKRGFTLVEILIVITVIAILAMIVIPAISGASTKSRAASLQGNLHTLREAIEHFYADTGVYPQSLSDIIVANGNALTGDYGTEAGVVKSLFHGPYLVLNGGISDSGIPYNPFVALTDLTISDHWTYNPADGSVHSAVSGITYNGTDISQL